MNRDRDQSGTGQSDLESPGVRKAYERPTILSRESIEVMAVACTPGPPTNGKESMPACGNLTS